MIDMLTIERRPYVRNLCAAALWLLLVAGCGGVDSGGTGTAAIVGPITGYGSIIVNGIRLDDAGAAIEDDEGRPQTQDELKLGMMTIVDATDLSAINGSQRATATSIRISSELLGPVDAIDTSAGTLTTLGQTVLITKATLFDERLPGGLAGLTPGTVVEIYGRYDRFRNRYAATRVEPRPTPAFYKLRGAISRFDASARIIVIGRQTIDYNAVPVSDRSNVATGAIVRVTFRPQSVNDVWTAIRLLAAVAQLPDRDEVQVEGRISAWVSSRQFSIDGIPVEASMAAFPDGEGGVVLGARVSVEGASVGGVVLAREVELESDEVENNTTFELHGAIESIDAAARTFVVRGVRVDYAGPVTFESGSAADLAAGRRVEVQGTLSTDGTAVQARQIEFEDG